MHGVDLCENHGLLTRADGFHDGGTADMHKRGIILRRMRGHGNGAHVQPTGNHAGVNRQVHTGKQLVSHAVSHSWPLPLANAKRWRISITSSGNSCCIC